MNEAEQIIRAQAGDETAWANLIRHHQTAVFRLAYLLLHDAEDAQDVAQETFMRAMHSLDRFDPARPLRPWLLEITRNLCFNWQRAWRRRWAAWQRWGESAQPHERTSQATILNEQGPNEQVMQQWQATLLWQAVRRLPDADQEVIYLRCFLELPVEETAQVLKIAQGTVKSRLSRARERLRQVIMRDFPALYEDYMEETLPAGVTE